MRSKLSLLAALAIGLAVTEVAFAFGLSKSSPVTAAATTIASCCPDGPCCRQMADSTKATMAHCDCPFCSGLATAAKASCCPDADCCLGGACCHGTALAKATKK
jgi:hypothetical protein